MSRISLARIVVGLLLIAAGLSALVLFGWWMRLLVGLSPDGQVFSASWLRLRIMITALVIPGIVLLGYRPFLQFLRWIDRRVQSLSMRTFLGVAVGGGGALRLIAVLAIPVHLHMDWAAYDNRAWTWAVEGEYRNGIYPTAFWPPGWPFLLSRLYLVFGRVPETGTFVNILFGAGIIWLTYLLIRAAWGEGKARWAALCVAVLPSQVLYTNVLCSEPMFTFLFLLAIVIVLHPAVARIPSWRIAVSGIVLGLATLTRTLTLLYPLLMIPLFVTEKGSRLARASRWLLLFVISIGVVVPWCIRNYNELGRFTISTNNGHNLYIGNNPMSRITYHDPDPAKMNVWDPAQEAHNDRIGYRLAFEHIVNHPVGFIWRGVLKTAFLLGSDTEALWYEIARAANDGRIDQYVMLAMLTQGVHFTFLMLAGLGVLFFLTSGRPRNGPAIMIALTILYWMAIHFVFYGNGRYHYPIVPMMAGFAGIAIRHLLDRPRPETPPHRPTV